MNKQEIKSAIFERIALLTEKVIYAIKFPNYLQHMSGMHCPMMEIDVSSLNKNQIYDLHCNPKCIVVVESTCDRDDCCHEGCSSKHKIIQINEYKINESVGITNEQPKTFGDHPFDKLG